MSRFIDTYIRASHHCASVLEKHIFHSYDGRFIVFFQIKSASCFLAFTPTVWRLHLNTSSSIGMDEWGTGSCYYPVDPPAQPSQASQLAPRSPRLCSILQWTNSRLWPFAAR